MKSIMCIIFVTRLVIVVIERTKLAYQNFWSLILYSTLTANKVERTNERELIEVDVLSLLICVCWTWSDHLFG